MKAPDLRASPRIAAMLNAHAQLGTAFLREAVTQISDKGLFLKTRFQISEGTAVRLAVSLPFGLGSTVCTLIGNVTRQSADANGVQQGIGIKLQAHEMTPTDRATWTAFVGRSLKTTSVQKAV